MADPYHYGDYPPQYYQYGDSGLYAQSPSQSLDPSVDPYHQQYWYNGQGEGVEQGLDSMHFGGDGGVPQPAHQGDHATEGEYSNIPDVLFLNHYCSIAHPPRDSSQEAKDAADLSWQPVREWLVTHSADEGHVALAAQQRGDSGMTALHVACRNVPPPDIVNILLTVAKETAQWPDTFGWLPIHYACACGADPDVIKSLADAFPESKTTVDRRGRTPLHFALGNANPESPISPAVVVLLSSSGAAGCADDNGMLPLHYACAYGASEEVLYVLTDAYDEAIMTMDRYDRTPLHFALSNAGRKAAPAAVRLLLTLRKDVVNSIGGGPLPLKVLADYAASMRTGGDKAQRESVFRCLEHLLSFNPDPTPDFFTALQALPDWLQERAVVMPSVQVLLNIKIAQRFPTGVLLSDLFFQIVVLVSYGIAVPLEIKQRRGSTTGPDFDLWSFKGNLIMLYVGGTYFLLRTLVQMLSLLALGAFDFWLKYPSNSLDIAYIFVVFFWAFQMDCDGNNNNMGVGTFRTGTCLSCVFLWTKLLAYLRNTYIDFAVFLGGLFYVIRRLAAFLVCLCIIIIAFSQMFFTVYQQTKLCRSDEVAKSDELEMTCQEFNEDLVYCDQWSAFLYTFTMLLGAVDDQRFKDNDFALVLFILFMFLVVILLANVLIAIVTDSYKIIQDQRAAIVFWTYRLVFVAEMDAVANGPWQTRIKQVLGFSRAATSFGRDTWKRLMDLFDDDIDDDAGSLEILCHILLRICAVVIIFCWVLFGLLTFGSVWPPQVREAIFTSKVLKHSSEAEKDDELRKTQIRNLQQEVQTLKDDWMQELAMDRTQAAQMKSIFTQHKQEIQVEMRHIQRILAMLFEQAAGN